MEAGFSLSIYFAIGTGLDPACTSTTIEKHDRVHSWHPSNQVLCNLTAPSLPARPDFHKLGSPPTQSCNYQRPTTLLRASLYQRYGPIVRSSPTEISVSSLPEPTEIHRAGPGFLNSGWYASFMPGREGVFTLRAVKGHAQRRKPFA